jgi:hypothetical protein
VGAMLGIQVGVQDGATDGNGLGIAVKQEKKN